MSTAMLLLSLWSAALLCLLCTTNACERATGRARFGGCESFVVKRVTEDHTAVDVDCDLVKTTWLVAVPKQRLSIHDFTVAGIPETVALALTQDADSARWCAIDEVAPAQPPPHAPADNDRYRQFDIDCATAASSIDAVAVIKARHVRVTVSEDEARKGGVPHVTIVKLE